MMLSSSKRVESSDGLPAPDLFNQPALDPSSKPGVPLGASIQSINSISLPFVPSQSHGPFSSKPSLPLPPKNFESRTLSVNTEPTRGWSASISNVSLPPSCMSPMSVAPSHAGASLSTVVPTAGPTKTTTSSNPIFNVPTAVGMASAALQSYLQPTAGTKFMAQGDWNTTTQYFTSKELLQIFTSVARINIEKLTDASGNILKEEPKLRISSAGGLISMPVGDDESALKQDGTLIWVKRSDSGSSASPVTVMVEVLNSKKPEVCMARGILALPEAWQTTDELYKATVFLNPVKGSASAKSFTAQVAIDVRELYKVHGGNGIVSWMFPRKESLDSMESCTELLAKAVKDGGRRVFSVNSFKAPMNAAGTNVSRGVMGANRTTLPYELSTEVMTDMEKACVDLADACPGSILAGTHAFAFVENASTDTQVLLLRNPALKQIIVSFRGAEMPCPNDVLENSKLTPEFWHAQGTDGNMLVSSGAVDAMQAWMHALFGGVSGPAVHCGFMNSWKSVQAAVEQAITNCTRGSQAWKLSFVGHSVGGAEATLAAASFAAAGWPKDKLALYTFGAPKVGNNEFAKTLESCIPNAWRIFSVTDVLPETPVASEYVHAGHACSFTQGLSSVGHIMFQYTPWLTVEGPGNVPVSSEAFWSRVSPIWAVQTIWDRLISRMVFNVSSYTGSQLPQHRCGQYMLSMLNILRDTYSGTDQKVLESIRAPGDIICTFEKYLYTVGLTAAEKEQNEAPSAVLEVPM